MSAAFDRLCDQARAVPIEGVVGGYGITLKRVSSQLEGPCPLCNDPKADNRFSVKWVKKKELFYCRICKVGGDVIRLVERVEHVDFKEAVKILTRDDCPRSAPTAPPAKPQKSDAERTRDAVDKWRKARPAPGTLVEVYLRSRGITIPPPLTLRFERSVWHPESDDYWPAMIGIVWNADRTPIAIHRTFLARDGNGKAPVTPQKKMLGPVSGGCVRLAAAIDGHIGVGEGLETCSAAMELAAMQGIPLPVWSALSAPGIESLNLPDDIEHVTVLADNDANGRGEDAARDAGRRWQREGRTVKIARPPVGVKDFADLLVAIREKVVS